VLCKEAGAKRALALNVSVPSHCSLMKPAAEQLKVELDRVQFNSPQIPVVQNVNAQTSEDPNLIKENLIKQLYVPVLWIDSVKYMRANGIEKLLECGPGNVLSGLIRRIDPQVSCFASDNPASLENAIAELLS
jgi:[acyl-carrier-protein] S-malonyltransferase